MSLLDVTRELHRTRPEHVRIVLTDFFRGDPKRGEVDEVLEMVRVLHTTFNPAPEEPKSE